MKIPSIKLEIKEILKQTSKAILVLLKNGNQQWLPLSICRDMNISKKESWINIAPFKYQEITGVIPQPKDEFQIYESNLMAQEDLLPDYELIDPKGMKLFDKQREKAEKIKRLKYSFIYGQMRSGKTIMAQAIAESRYKKGIINNLIVISPL